MAKKGRVKLYPGYVPHFRGKRPIALKIGDKSYEIKAWRDALLRTCDYVLEAKPNEFAKILSLKGRKRLWFSRDPQKLKAPLKIEGTNNFAEGNANANGLILMCYHVLRHFGMETDIKS
jgi:negative regulator of replication initiation